MKKIFYASLLTVLVSSGVQATMQKSAVSDVNSTTLSAEEVSGEQTKTAIVTRGDIKILEATENIRFLSQQIVKEYLFLFKTPQKEAVKEKLNRLLVKLNNDLRVIATTTKDSDTKDILEFLAYSKDQIAQTLTEALDEEQAALMLDYSETLLEGADSIAAAHTYDFTKEERMLMLTKQMEYLIERIMKYYMAVHVGFDNPTNRDQMHEAIAELNTNIQEIEAYSYPKEIDTVKNKMISGWSDISAFWKKSETLFIPKLMLMSTAYLEEQIEQITLYHNQNQ
jgi:ribosomal protein S24E